MLPHQLPWTSWPDLSNYPWQERSLWRHYLAPLFWIPGLSPCPRSGKELLSESSHCLPLPPQNPGVQLRPVQPHFPGPPGPSCPPGIFTHGCLCPRCPLAWNVLSTSVYTENSSYLIPRGITGEYLSFFIRSFLPSMPSLFLFFFPPSFLSSRNSFTLFMHFE